MNNEDRKANKLIKEKSPYLLQHAYNPVNWYPWGEEAFEKAKTEDKPIFLSIGYSTCHWCHVMAHESFENIEVATILNKNFISIKVDKEERPDIDSIYMNMCQSLTGSGGWPTTIFMSSNQQPFFAGTYFPTQSRYGIIGFTDLIVSIGEKWVQDKEKLIQSGNEITKLLKKEEIEKSDLSTDLITGAMQLFKKSFDKTYGGFGNAPKFPTAHNLLFLMEYYENTKDKEALEMVEKTLIQMYKGGIFDHIGFGFSRYSTDRFFLAPHFEKMLYDNALLMISYSKAFAITNNKLFKEVAEKIAEYVLRELTHPKGGFYCAQDADSEGVEGKYYVFDYSEIIQLLGNEIGVEFNDYYGITKEGNFEGKSIPNLLTNTKSDGRFDSYLNTVYDYRKSRTLLHLDDKILTSWNALMIAAFAILYRVVGNEKYLEVAQNACCFLEENLTVKDTLYVSFRDGKISNKGFIDDYAFYIYALINMYESTLENSYLERAISLNNKAIDEFYDKENSGFYLYGKNNETLILKPKETYDGAMPSGNSVMAYNLVKLASITKNMDLDKLAKEQLEFMASHASHYLAGYSFYLMALSLYIYPSKEVVCVLRNKKDREKIRGTFAFHTSVTILETGNDEYKLMNEKTTFYVCENRSCKPPTNNVEEAMR
ncbi:MAG: thioredoxin domain-containing protein [Lachnotalea sp.]